MEENKQTIIQESMQFTGEEASTARAAKSTSYPPEHPGYGKCADCSCPGFSGSGYTCSRGGCKHHYDRHW